MIDRKDNKELNNDWGLGMLDYGARMYMADVGQFITADPLSEETRSNSSYHYAFSNPIRYIDFMGLSPYTYDWETSSYKNESGENVAWSEVKKYIDGELAKEENKDMAILVAFPEQNPAIPSNEGIGAWWERNVGNNNGKADGAGHAGIVIINGETGATRYFDFGRYDRPGLSDRGQNEGSVRSSTHFSGLRIPNWSFNISDDKNVENILSSLHSSPVLRGYGPITGALAKGLSFQKMLEYATTAEEGGYLPFGGYSSSSGSPCNATYCAKFARGVAGAGGANFGPFVFTGQGNVDYVAYWHGTNVITVK